MAAVPTRSSGMAFPERELAERLESRFRRLADILSRARGDWEPLLDSLAIVEILIDVEDLVDLRLPPEKVVRRGGYRNVDEAVTDVVANIKVLWSSKYRVVAA